MLCGAAIQWTARKQTTVALSSVESEFIAICSTAQELMYISSLLNELGFEQECPTLQSDSQGAKAFAENPISKSRLKHIDIKYFFVRQGIQDKVFKLSFVRSHQNLADLMTKALPLPAFSFLVARIMNRGHEINV